MQLAPGATLTEETPLETLETAHDSYARAKLQQELMCRAAPHPLWVLRPGAVYGPTRSWHAQMGFWASKLHVQINSEGQLPLVHVDHLAASLIDAASTPPNGVATVNVVDDDLPTRQRFLDAHHKMAGWPRLTFYISFKNWLLLARLLKPVSAILPGLFHEPILRARVMPLTFPNTELRTALGGADQAPFEQMLAKSLEPHT
jgi:nucleoside-diphosphate-sugar epimerase